MPAIVLCALFVLMYAFLTTLCLGISTTIVQMSRVMSTPLENLLRIQTQATDSRVPVLSTKEVSTGEIDKNSCSQIVEVETRLQRINSCIVHDERNIRVYTTLQRNSVRRGTRVDYSIKMEKFEHVYVLCETSGVQRKIRYRG